jgi:hypothetical protein
LTIARRFPRRGAEFAETSPQGWADKKTAD